MSTGRGKYVAAGVGVLLLAGVVYAWSVLAVPIAAEFSEWSKAKLSVTFTLVMFLFCTGQIITGFAGDRLKPKTGVWLGGALLLAGFFIASKAQSAGVLYLGFGVLGGLGAGVAYIAVMSSVVKWFPDKRGLVSGVLLMGFGFSSFIIGKLYQAWTPEYTGAWRGSFVILGLITFAVLFLCGFFLKKPLVNAANGHTAESGLTTGEMLKKPKFWYYYLWELVLTCAGLMVISQASGMVKAASAEISAGSAATIVGLISIFNGLGRVAFGSLYDKKGRRVSILLDSLLFGGAGLLMFLGEKNGGTGYIIAAFVLLGAGYGGVPVCNSAFIGESFGMAHYQTNFPVCNSAMLPASLGSILAGALYDATGGYMAVVAVIFGFTAVSLVCSGLITATEKRQ